ncbi:MAG TPA: hypothetical protein VG322_15460 [Candidatus Acidoferrales bacterium]|nr:hypothetical protein [Candidatus Acidoferrales bacterium]
MSEGRKRVLLIAATILAARKLAQIDKPCPALEFCISDAISKAEKMSALLSRLARNIQQDEPHFIVDPEENCEPVQDGCGGWI